MFNIILVFLQLLAKLTLKQKGPFRRLAAQRFIQRVKSRGPEVQKALFEVTHSCGYSSVDLHCESRTLYFS